MFKSVGFQGENRFVVSLWGFLREKETYACQTVGIACQKRLHISNDCVKVGIREAEKVYSTVYYG